MHAVLVTVISFVFVLGVLVFIHELGHYLAARWRGIHVDVFSIGFGNPLYRWQDKVGTEWRICPIPLGGYVKLHGFEDPEDATEEQKAAWKAGKTFHEKSLLSRAIVIFAGPFFNFILAILLFAGVFFFAGKPVMQPMIGGIVADGAASKAGLKVKDAIIKIDKLTNPAVSEIVNFAQSHPGLSTQLIVKRDNKEITLPLTIASKTVDGKTIGLLGIQLAENYVGKQRLSFGSSLITASHETWTLSVEMVKGIGQLVTGQRSAKELGGPLRIAQISGQVAEQGFDKLILMMAILSINLGLINLFPIPILDGGRLLFYIVEGIYQKPIPKKIQAWCFQIGFILIALLFLFTMYNDIIQLKVISWIINHGKALLG